MSRRLVLMLSLLVVVVAAAWLRRGGDAPAPEPGAARAPGATPGARGLTAREPGFAAVDPAAPAGAPAIGAGAPGGAPRPRYTLEPDLTFDETVRVALEDPDPSRRARAIADLSLEDDLEPVVPVLRQAAADPDPDVKLALVMALAQFDEAVPMDLLRQFASDPDPEIRMEVLDLVETLSHEDSIPDQVRPLLMAFTRDPDEEISDKAREVIEQLAGGTGVDGLED